MFTSEMLPVLILILFIQINILVWYIIQIVRNSEFSESKKMLWIALLIFFQIFGVLGYLIVTRKRYSENILKDMGNELDENIQDCIFLGLFYTFEIIMLIFVYINPGNYWIIATLSVASLLMVILHFYREKMGKVLRFILPYVFILLVIISQYLSASEEYGFIILMAAGAIIIDYPLEYSKVYFWFPLVMFIVGSWLKMYITDVPMPDNYIFDFLLMNIITYILVLGAFYFSKRQLVMNNYLQYLMSELKNKTQELEEASVLKERNRIAREIHDTLGHALTGAIIQLEVAKQLVRTSPDGAEESIQKTQDITRQGFNDVKRAIKALRPIMIDENTLLDGLKLLFERVYNDYSFIVKDNINLPEIVSDELKVSVYRIVQEMITNSMRHGEADKMVLNIEHQFDMLRIDCRDNGKGCEMIKEGNGLKGIKERVEKLNGHVSFSSRQGKGFGAVIYIPQ